MDGEQYLGSLIRDRLRLLARTGGASQQERGTTYIREVDLVASALVSVGALERAKAERILQELRDTLLEREIIDPSTILVGAFGDDVPVGPAAWGESLAPTSPRLVRVVPIVRDLGQVVGGPSVSLISIEIWSDHFALRFAITRPPIDEAAREPEWTWRIEDDSGTVYERVGGGGSGEDRLWRGELRFRPAPPSDATKLVLVARRVGSPRSPSPPGSAWRDAGPVGEELFSVEVPLDGDVDQGTADSQRRTN